MNVHDLLGKDVKRGYDDFVAERKLLSKCSICKSRVMSWCQVGMVKAGIPETLISPQYFTTS